MMKRFVFFIHTARMLSLYACAVSVALNPLVVKADTVAEHERVVGVQGLRLVSALSRTGVQSLFSSDPHDHNSHKHNENDLYGICPVDSAPDFGNLEVINGQCLPASSIGGTQNFRRDLSICQCLENNPETLQGLAYSLAKSADPDSDSNRQTQLAMNDNITRLNASLAAEQTAMQFQASTLPASESSNEFLIGAFTNRLEFDLNSRVAEIRRRAQEGYAQASAAEAENSIPMRDVVVPPRPDGDLLSPPADASQQLRYCVPVREFMTANQMPSDPLFYQDLATLPGTYRQADWDYHRLKINFIRMLPDGVATLSEALNNPEAKKIYLRIQFLERNPLYRNLFSSTSPGADTKKQELWNMIRGAYGEGSRPEDRFDHFTQLRKDTGTFFTSGTDVIEMAQNGANQNFELLLREVPLRVNKISQSFEPDNIWLDAVMKKGTGLRMFGPDEPNTNRSNTSVYAHYCPRLQWASRQNQFTVLSEIEESFGNIYEPFRPESDYSKLTQKLCNDEERTAPDGTRKRWPQFLRDLCPAGNSLPQCAPEKRLVLLSKFLKDFPQGDPTPDSLAHLMPFLVGAESVPAPDSVVARRAAQEGRAQTFITSATTRARLAQANADFRSSGGSMSKARRSRTATIAVTSNKQTTENQQQNQKLQNNHSLSAPVVLPLTETAGDVTPVPAVPGTLSPEVVRTEIARTDTEMQDLREEIAGLTRELQNETAKPTAERDNSEILELNRKVDSLATRLELTTAENNRLRRIASEQTQEEERPRRRPASPDSDDEVPAKAQPSAVTPLAALSNQKNERSPAVPGVVSGGATLGRVTGERKAAGSINNALLANQRYAEATATNGSAITVSVANTAEYQQLRSQSGEAISESVPNEVFERIAEGDTSVLTDRFSDRLPTRTGERRLYEIRSDGAESSTIEVIVTRTDNGLSVTFGQNRAPAAVAPVERENTLDGLNQRIQESR